VQLDRRAFLVGALATGALACTGTESGEGATRAAGEADRQPRLSGPAFTLGVASGDPTSESVILWTRLAPDPLRGGGMPDADIEVEWEVAREADFSDIVTQGIAVASPSVAHAVHVDAAGLEPDSWYAYRFRVGDEISMVGRTRTLPAADASPERFRIAVANCQDYQGGRYAAHRDIAADDYDIVLFLGDYIYEAPGLDDPEQALAQRKHYGGVPVSLADYRTRYAQYRLDPQLQAAHASCPWIVTFDDHEVVNNYAGADGALAGTGAEFVARRTAAYEAWWEHMPLRVPAPVDGRLEVHRDLRWGDLAHLFVIETRQNADTPPCRDTSNFDAGPDCEERNDPARTALGAEQKTWLFDGLASADATWTVLGNPVLLAGLDIADPGNAPQYWLETWDGYPVERRELAQFLIDEQVPNPVVLTGDYHANFVNQVKPDPWDPASPVAATEVLATAVSSGLYGYDYRASNPQIEWFEGEHHGFVDCEITPDEIRARFRFVADVNDPDSIVTTGAEFVLEPGQPPRARQV
jgi:alkaline phosphatase D